MKLLKYIYITFKWNIVKEVRLMKGHMHAMVWDSNSMSIG